MDDTNNIPPPPPGFDAGGQAPPPPPPGFSAGGQAPSPPPPPPGFSAGGPAAPAAQPGFMQQMKTYDPTVGLLSGALKEAQKHVAGAIDMVNKYVIAPHDPGATATTQRVSDAATAAANWLKKGTSEDTLMEQAGGWGESGAELLDPGMWGGKAVEGMSYADRLAAMAKNAKVLEKNPGLIKVIRAGAEKLGLNAASLGVGAAETAAKTGTQGFVESGGDPEKAKEAATIGAIAHVGLGTVIGAARAGAGVVSDFAKRNLLTEPIAGADFEVTPEGQLKIRPPKPGTPEAATTAVEKAQRNIAQDGIRGSIDRTNANAINVPDVQVGGKPILASTGPMSEAEARAASARYDRLLADRAAVKGMSSADHEDLLFKAHDLREQLGRWDEFKTNQRPDTGDMVANTDSLATAGRMLQDSHGFALQGATTAEDGLLPKLRNEETFLRGKVNDPMTVDKANELQQRLTDNQKAQLDFFDRNSANMNPGEVQMHREGLEDGQTLSDLHDFFEQRFNGITRDDAGKGLTRVFRPGQSGTSAFDSFLDKTAPGRNATNGEILQRTIGDDHITNLKKVVQLFENPEEQKATKPILEAVRSAFWRHKVGIASVGTPALAVAHMAGLGVKEMAGAGVAAGVTGYISHIADRITTDPEFAQKFIYATKNRVGPRLAGPLLAMPIIKAMGLNEPQPPTIQNKQVVAPDASRGVQPVTLPVVTPSQGAPNAGSPQ
jgi:hypothetical protein